MLIIWRRQPDGFIRWPLMFKVDGLAFRSTQLMFAAVGVHDVCDDLERDVKYVSWGWLAYLYRWLPTYANYLGGARHEGQKPAYYLWIVSARRWHIGWMPRRRSPTYGGRWGALLVSTPRHDRRFPL